MLKYFIAIMVSLALMGCSTSDSTLRDSGYNSSYIQGFHDGRHSGLKEAGNDFESYIRDEQRFHSDNDYKLGWQAGESEGKRLQTQANAVGQGLATGYSESHKSKDLDDVAKDAVKDVDTTGFDDLK